MSERGASPAQDAPAAASGAPDTSLDAAAFEGRGAAGVAKLARSLHAKTGLIRKTAARRLGETGRLEAIPHLVAALGDEDGEVREEAARALGRLRAADARIVLEGLLGDDWPPARRAAQEALQAIERGGAPVPAAARPPAPPSARRAALDALVTAALEGSGATCVRSPFGYEVEVALGARKQRVRVILEGRDDDGDALILVETTCGQAHPGSYKWALRENYKFMHGHLALRRSGDEEQFVFRRTLLERETQPAELRKAILAAGREGDRIEHRHSGGRDDH